MLPFWLGSEKGPIGERKDLSKKLWFEGLYFWAMFVRGEDPVAFKTPSLAGLVQL